MNNQRLTYIDLGAGIMIVWLLFFHASYPMYGKDVFCVFPFFFFFMPWFFYKSGYFFKPVSLYESVRRDAKKLLRQFVIWSIIGYIVFLLWHTLVYHDTSLRLAIYSPLRSLLLNGSIPLNTALWFLLTLFFVRQIAIMTFSRINVIFVSIISMILAWAIHFWQYQYMPWTINTTAWGLFFFCAGNYMKKYEQNKWVIIVSIFVLVVTYALTNIPEVYTRENEIQWYWYILWYPASIAGCVTFNTICRWLDVISRRMLKNALFFNPFPLLRWIGRHSMIFYVAHYIIFRMTFNIVARINEGWYGGMEGLLIVAIAYALIIIPLCFIYDKIQN